MVSQKVQMLRCAGSFVIEAYDKDASILMICAPCLSLPQRRPGELFTKPSNLASISTFYEFIIIAHKLPTSFSRFFHNFRICVTNVAV